MILSNIETIPGHNIIAHFGLVSGNTVRAKHVGKDFLAGLKNIVGGELRGYTELLEEARYEAVQRMMHQAQSMGANAIINVRFSTSAVTQGAAELYVYGTAVQIQPLAGVAAPVGAQPAAVGAPPLPPQHPQPPLPVG